MPALKSPGFYDALTTLFGYDIRDRLEEIEDPTLIVWGRNDRVVPVPAALSYKSGSATTPSSTSSTAPATCRRWSGRSALQPAARGVPGSAT